MSIGFTLLGKVSSVYHARWLMLAGSNGLPWQSLQDFRMPPGRLASAAITLATGICGTDHSFTALDVPDRKSSVRLADDKPLVIRCECDGPQTAFFSKSSQYLEIAIQDDQAFLGSHREPIIAMVDRAHIRSSLCWFESVCLRWLVQTPQLWLK